MRSTSWSTRKWQVMTLPRVLLAVVSLLSALLVSVHFAAPAAAPLSQTTVITNNIQGASTTAGGNSANTDSKWTTQIRQYIQAAAVVLVQERQLHLHRRRRLQPGSR